MRAATIGPDSFGYTARDLAAAFEDISGTGTPILSGDDIAAAAAIGFSFKFYGVDYPSVAVSTNGLLSFTAPNPSPANGT